MTETFFSLAQQLQYLFTHVTISNLIDMFLVACLIFIAFQALYQTRAMQMLRGVIIAAILGVGLLVLLPLNTLNYLVRFVLIAGAIALPILFQDELRRVLVGLGQFGRRRGAISNFDRFEQSLIQASRQMSSQFIGALIVLEGQTLLEDVVKSGVRMEADVISAELLQTIFSPKTPLHDGAIVLRGDRLVAASCILPVQMDDIGNSQLGTRHRAALGLSSKVQDALVIIISEETGWISAAFAGRLYLNLSPAELEDWINRFGEQLKDAGKFHWAWLGGGGWRSTLTNLVTSVGLAVIAWLIVVYQTNPPQQTVLQGVPLVLQGPSQGLVIMDELPDTVNVLVRTTRDRIEEFSSNSVHAVIDLARLPAGSYTVPVQARTSDPSLGAITVKPAAFDVTLENELSQEITPTIRISDLESLPAGYLVDEVTINPQSVTVTGPESLLERLSNVQLDIAVNERRGTFQESSIPTAVDLTGAEIEGVAIYPERVVVTVPILRTTTTRESGIQPVVDRSGLQLDYEVTGIEVIPSTVTLTGPQTALHDAGPFIETAPISLTNQVENFSTSIPLIIPEGINVLNEEGEAIRNVTVQISISPVTGYLVLQKQILVTQIDVDLTITMTPQSASVLLIGPQVLLDQVSQNPDIVSVSLQVDEPVAGTRALPLVILAPPGLEAQSFPKEVQVIIEPR